MQLSKSPRINALLFKMGVYSYYTALSHLPYRYEDMALSNENNLFDKERLVLEGKLISTKTLSRFRNMCLVKFTFLSTTNHIYFVEAWNRAYLCNALNSEDVYTLVGNYDLSHKKINLITISKVNRDNNVLIKPIYSLPNGLDNYFYSRLIKKAFAELNGEIYDVVPAYFRKKYRLESRYLALQDVHEPKSMEDVNRGRRVLKYEECLLYSLKSQMIRQENKLLLKNSLQHIDEIKLKDFISHLNYSLTSDQKIVVDEIIHDMNQQTLMYRLLQGDVGTGKTLVAAIALYGNYLRNDQGVLMAPTDALARQHFITFRNIFKNYDIRIALLVGATPQKERRQILNALINQEIDMVVGTHALFSKDVNFSSLGLAIIDEQHRFGVNQRLMLTNKGSHADLLLMSATPIPRTLSMSIYGDLDISSLHDFPGGCRNVSTRIVKSKDKIIYTTIDESLNNNKKIFIIAPIIDEGDTDRISVEQLYAHFLLRYKEKVALVHGKMSIEEKNQALVNFYKGITPILVATTVIEVGLDVKDANLMIVYDASSFGLASLHQLRGRIGRDGSYAKFLLVNDGGDKDELNKLNVLVNTSDGFKIAEEDLKRRGPGEFIGTKQSGLPSFNFINIVSDFKMFEIARDDANFILKNKDEIGFKYIINKAKEEIDKSFNE